MILFDPLRSRKGPQESYIPSVIKANEEINEEVDTNRWIDDDDDDGPATSSYQSCLTGCRTT